MAGVFGFVTCPGSVRGLAVGLGLPLAKWLPGPLLEGLADMKGPVAKPAPSVAASKGARCEGRLIDLRMSRERFERLSAELVAKKLGRARRVAAAEGVTIMGVHPAVAHASGLLSSSVREVDTVLAEMGDLPISCGMVYSIAVLSDAIAIALSVGGRLLSDARVTILGADNTCGALLARVMAPHVGALSLWGSSQPKLERLSSLILHEQGLATRVYHEFSPLTYLHDCDVLVATCTLDRLLGLRDIEDDAVVVDGRLALSGGKAEREVFDEELAVSPRTVAQAAVSLPGDSIVPAYYAEAIALAMSGQERNTGVGGRTSLEEVVHMRRYAEACGHYTAGYYTPRGRLMLADAHVLSNSDGKAAAD